jgi:ankyrin repeat protein
LLRELFILCASTMKTQNAPISEVVNIVSQLKRRGDVDNEDYLGCMNENNETPIKVAVNAGNKIMVGILLEKGDECVCSEAFLAACRIGKKEILNLLLESGTHSDLDMHMRTDCILLCTKHGFTCLLKMLHKAGFLLKNNGTVVTLKFPENSKFPMLWRLQTNGSLLHVAAGNGHHRVMEYLINQLADIESVDSCGWKPVHLAIQGGKNCLIMLLEAGVDIDAADNEGRSPLFLAGIWGNF